MHNKYLTLLIATICFNTAYGMDNDKQLQLTQQKEQLRELLGKDSGEALNIVSKLTTGWTDSNKCLYTSLLGITLCSLAFLGNKNSNFSVARPGMTLFIGAGVLAMATMYDEKKRSNIYLEDQNELDISMQKLTKIINEFQQITEDANNNATTTTMTSQTKIVNRINDLETLTQCNQNYRAILDIIKKFTTEYLPSKICFYIALTGMTLCSLALIDGEHNYLNIVGMGSVLFLGAGLIGTVSGTYEQQNLKSYMTKKASTREAILKLSNQS